MSVEDEETIDSPNDTTEEVDNTEEVEDVADADVSETEDKPEYTEFEKKQYERAKLAEAEAKELKAKLKALESKALETKSKPEASKKADDGLSSMDTIALIGAKVTDKEDIDEVLDYAKHKGITVAEALKTSVIKTILTEKAEQRTTAEATNTGGARRGSTRPTGNQILNDVAQGKLPEDPADYADAYWESRRKK